MSVNVSPGPPPATWWAWICTHTHTHTHALYKFFDFFEIFFLIFWKRLVCTIKWRKNHFFHFLPHKCGFYTFCSEYIIIYIVQSWEIFNLNGVKGRPREHWIGKLKFWSVTHQIWTTAAGAAPATSICFVLFCVSFKLSYRTEAIEYVRRRPLGDSQFRTLPTAVLLARLCLSRGSVNHKPIPNLAAGEDDV